MEVSGQLHAPAALFPGEEPQYLLNVLWCGPQSFVEVLKKGRFFDCAGIRILAPLNKKNLKDQRRQHNNNNNNI